MLTLQRVETGYGGKCVLDGVNLHVPRGQLVALIGPNGSGKSTVARVIYGLLPVWRGDIIVSGIRLKGGGPRERIRCAIGYAPQGQRVFTDLTILENLEVAGHAVPRHRVRARISEVLDMFTPLKERTRQRAGTLSGGERQMLALARALLQKPELLIVDEPSLGLSPAVSNVMFQALRQLVDEKGVTLLVIEQRVREVTCIADYLYGLRLGRVAIHGKPSELQSAEVLRNLFLT